MFFLNLLFQDDSFQGYASAQRHIDLAWCERASFDVDDGRVYPLLNISSRILDNLSRFLMHKFIQSKEDLIQGYKRSYGRR